MDSIAKRPRTRLSPQKRKQQLMEIALEVFARRGIGQVEKARPGQRACRRAKRKEARRDIEESAFLVRLVGDPLLELLNRLPLDLHELLDDAREVNAGRKPVKSHTSPIE